MLSVQFGNNHPDIRSLDSSADVNFMWVPAALFSLGLWAGFLSGYVKMKIWDS
jgi:hypothetical protein